MHVVNNKLHFVSLPHTIFVMIFKLVYFRLSYQTRMQKRRAHHDAFSKRYKINLKQDNNINNDKTKQNKITKMMVLDH